jgi:hypothetical protein
LLLATIIAEGSGLHHFANRQSLGEDIAKAYHAGMEEGRKRVLLIAASILAARKLAPYEGGTPVPATISAIADAERLGGADNGGDR